MYKARRMEQWRKETNPHLYGACFLAGKRDHKQVVYLIRQRVIGGMKTNKTGSGMRRARKERCIAVLSRMTKQGLQGDLGKGEGNERLSHVDGWG